MRDAALRLLACPACRGELALVGNGAAARDPDGHVITGELACAACGARFPIERGVPRLLTARTTAASTETSARFGASGRSSR